MSEYVEEDRIPIKEIIEKINPRDLLKAESKKTIDFNSTPISPKLTDISSRGFKKRSTF
jgi:hypothetical protein